MGVDHVDDLSLGQWSAICERWDKAHSDGRSNAAPPTEDEFEAAMLRARGVKT